MAEHLPQRVREAGRFCVPSACYPQARFETIIHPASNSRC